MIRDFDNMNLTPIRLELNNILSPNPLEIEISLWTPPHWMGLYLENGEWPNMWSNFEVFKYGEIYNITQDLNKIILD